MRRILLICCLVAANASPASAQLDTLWARTFGGTANDGFRSVVPTGDGGFVAVGYTYSFGDADVNVYAVKTDADGNEVWSKTYGGSGRDYGYGVCEMSDGGFAIVGYTTSFGAGQEDVYLIRTDAGGDTVWTRTYGGAGPDEGKAVCATGDGYLVVTGGTESYGAGLMDLYALKIDAAGDTVWTRVLGGTLCDWGRGVCQTLDGCYAISGTSGSNTANLDMYLVKYDPDGNLVHETWHGNAGAVDPDWALGLCATPDSGYAVAGYIAVEGSDPGEACYRQVDAAGNQTTFRRHWDPYYEYGCDICPTHDAGVLICGSDKDEDTQKNDLLLTKRESGIGWAWDQILGGAGSDWGSSIDEIESGEYIIAGHTESFGAGRFDGWLIRAHDPASAVSDAEVAASAAFLSVPSPNPFNPAASISFGIPEASRVQLAVYDISGRRIATLVDRHYQAGEFSAFWDGRDERGRQVASGVYMARMVAGEFSAAEKMILLK